MAVAGTRLDADRTMHAVHIDSDGTLAKKQYHLKYEREGTIFYHGLNDQPFPIMLPPPHEHVLLRGPSIVIVGVTPEGLNQAVKPHVDALKHMAQHLKASFEPRAASGSKSAASKMAAKRHSSVINKALMRRRTSGGRGGEAAVAQAPDAAAAADVAPEEEQLEEEELEEEEEDLYEEEEEEVEEDVPEEEEEPLEEDDEAAEEEEIEE